MFQVPQTRQKSVMAHDFSKVASADVPRSAFRCPSTHKTTFDADGLVPVYCSDVLPGDTFDFEMNFICRLASPLEKPLMDVMYLDCFHFWIPWRLVYELTDKFFGAETDPGDLNNQTIPQLPLDGATGAAAGTTADYFGLPTLIPNMTVNAMPFRCYNLCYNEHFRDQNLQDSVVVDLDAGPDTWADYSTILKRGKRKDYITSGLPYPQKSDSPVSLPLGTSADIHTAAGDNEEPTVYSDALSQYHWMDTAGGIGDEVMIQAAGGSAALKMYADLSTATAATVNEMREAVQTQRMYERDARAGTRYPEYLKAHYNVECEDYRVQRPELLGISSHAINLTPIAQTSEKTASEQGSLTAIGTVQGRSGYNKSFVEHGYVMSIVSVRADVSYQDGFPRMWNKADRVDIYHPVFAHLGEQAVLEQEVYAVDHTQDTGATGTVDNLRVFAYQVRWAEYRYDQSRITGNMRSNHGTILDVYHLSEDWTGRQTLNAAFIVSNATAPIDRVIATPAEPQFVFDGFFNVTKVRPMPTHSVPGLMDHL